MLTYRRLNAMLATSGLTLEQGREALGLWRSGWDTSGIAKALIPPPSEAAVANFIALYRDALHVSWAPRRPAGRAVPGWVRDADLVREYNEFRALRDEHAAAAHCRRLTAEMRGTAR